MIKIAYLLTPIDFGGSERVNLIFLEKVDRENYHIIPILLVRPWEKKNTFISKIEKLEYKFYKIPVAKRPKKDGTDYFRLIRAAIRLYQILKYEQCSILHCHGYFSNFIGIPISKILNITHISTCHGFIENHKKLKIYYKIEKFLLRYSNRIIAVSENIKENLISSGVKKKKIAVIKNSINVNRDRVKYHYQRKKIRNYLKIREDEILLGFIGRLSKEKGVEYLIDAYNIINKTHKNYKLILIGDGPIKKVIKNKMMTSNTKNNILIVGFKENIEKWLPGLDLFILPSLTEGTPMALLEAMNYGLPVIATKVGGVPKIIKDGHNGILINPCKTEELVSVIINLENKPILKKTIGKKASETIIKYYDSDKWYKKLQSQYILKNNIK